MTNIKFDHSKNKKQMSDAKEESIDMRKFRTVFMRGGTSKGCMFKREDLPDRSQWDEIFLQAMGDPDPKQIDGLG